MEDLKLYIEEIRDFPLLTKQEEIALGKKIKDDGDADASETLVLCNLRLVIAIARKYYTNTSLSLLDLIQEGNIGLIKASRRFDYTLGYRFSTYATYWIRQSISQAITNNSRTIRLPLHAVLELNRINRLNNALTEPTIAELAQATNLSEDRVKLLLEADNKMLSLDYDYDINDDNCNLNDIVPNVEDTPEMEFDKAESKRELYSIIDSLGNLEAKSIKLRYGLNGEKPKSLEQIGKELNISRDKAKQIINSAMNTLRQPQYINLLREIM